MIFIIDEGSKFDAPLSKVLKLLQTEGAHKHPSQLNPSMSMEGEHPVLSFQTKSPYGSMASHKIRMTMLGPVGFLVEYTDGPLSGTKLMQYYISKGDKTGFTIVGDVKSAFMKDDQLKAAVMKGLETDWREGRENLKKL